MKKEEIKGKILICPRCKYTWKYKGCSDWYTSCPRCHSNVSVNLKKMKIKCELCGLDQSETVKGDHAKQRRNE